jgi:hypothetical protein
MKPLYEIMPAFMSALESIDPADPATLEAVDDLECDLKTKLANYLMQAENLEAEANAVSAVVKRQQARIKSLNEKAAWLKAKALEAAELAGITAINTAEITAKIRKNPPSLQIYDSSLIPEEFMTWVPPSAGYFEPDKSAIKSAITKDGLIIEGASITYGSRWDIK